MVSYFDSAILTEMFVGIVDPNSLKQATASSLRIFSSLFFVEHPTFGAVSQSALLTAR
jgi:hypothetical protein